MEYNLRVLDYEVGKFDSLKEIRNNKIDFDESVLIKVRTKKKLEKGI